MTDNDEYEKSVSRKITDIIKATPGAVDEFSSVDREILVNLLATIWQAALDDATPVPNDWKSVFEDLKQHSQFYRDKAHGYREAGKEARAGYFDLLATGVDRAIHVFLTSINKNMADARKDSS